MGILFPFLFSFCSLCLSFCLSQSPASGVPSRAPHGLAYQPPLQLPPNAVEFFNPQPPLENVDPPASSPEKTSPESSVKPRATAIRARQVMVGGDEARGGNHGTGAAAAILFTLVFAVLLAMSAYYVFLARRRDASLSQPAKPAP
ncbi:unnamed protein product [Victoria cruziana]